MTFKKDAFKELQFNFPFRKYQNLILHQVETSKEKDNKYHIVAPPGSGKTIVGLELIRRFGEPAVVSNIKEARERIRLLKKNNPQIFSRELSII